MYVCVCMCVSIYIGGIDTNLVWELFCREGAPRSLCLCACVSVFVFICIACFDSYICMWNSL